MFLGTSETATANSGADEKQQNEEEEKEGQAANRRAENRDETMGVSLGAMAQGHVVGVRRVWCVQGVLYAIFLLWCHTLPVASHYTAVFPIFTIRSIAAAFPPRSTETCFRVLQLV